MDSVLHSASYVAKSAEPTMTPIIYILPDEDAAVVVHGVAQMLPQGPCRKHGLHGLSLSAHPHLSSTRDIVQAASSLKWGRPEFKASHCHLAVRVCTR